MRPSSSVSVSAPGVGVEPLQRHGTPQRTARLRESTARLFLAAEGLYRHARYPRPAGEPVALLDLGRQRTHGASPRSCSMIAGFSSVETSWVISSPRAIARSRRRMILPERVFGRLSV